MHGYVPSISDAGSRGKGCYEGVMVPCVRFAAVHKVIKFRLLYGHCDPKSRRECFAYFMLVCGYYSFYLCFRNFACFSPTSIVRSQGL